MKLEIGLREQFFSRQIFFFKNFDFNDRFKNKIEDNNQKISCRCSETISHEIDLTVNGLHKDHPPTWGLIHDFLFKIVFLGVMELTKSKHVQPHWLDRGVIGFISKTESQVRKNSIISHATLWPVF